MSAILEAMRAFFEKYKIPAIVVGSIVGALVIGLIIAAAMGAFVPATLPAVAGTSVSAPVPAFAETFVLQPILADDGSYDEENDVGAAGSYTRLASLDSYTQTPASGEEFVAVWKKDDTSAKLYVTYSKVIASNKFVRRISHQGAAGGWMIYLNTGETDAAINVPLDNQGVWVLGSLGQLVQFTPTPAASTLLRRVLALPRHAHTARQQTPGPRRLQALMKQMPGPRHAQALEHKRAAPLQSRAPSVPSAPTIGSVPSAPTIGSVPSAPTAHQRRQPHRRR